MFCPHEDAEERRGQKYVVDGHEQSIKRSVSSMSKAAEGRYIEGIRNFDISFIEDRKESTREVIVWEICYFSFFEKRLSRFYAGQVVADSKEGPLQLKIRS